ncbi:MAG: hypothetical protein Q4A03_09680 [Rothia sp. (in: high G+C Gram-positive bacteria)]|uniref:membrane protein YczE n=1 Tax=Rothia sp. (in: high G+C Gram-positive bacteria) TaxID=1885016 RepID=UPI0026FD8480|nr:hypothetical protein [Rothia sp. (in: high G+C Gram-positive bacteria)]
MAQSAPRPLAHLGPLQQLRAGKLALRLPLLVVGLVGFGASCALLIKAGLGTLGWDVLTLGLMEITGLSYGVLTIATSFVVLLFWLPLKEMPGLGTLANAVLVGLSADIAMDLIPDPAWVLAQWVYLVVGILAFSFFDALYLGAQFGSGPRDGLMTGLVRVTGRPVWLVRTVLEVTVVAAGIAMGGHFGVGTLLIAFTVGPLIGWFLPYVTVPLTPRPRPVS